MTLTLQTFIWIASLFFAAIGTDHSRPRPPRKMIQCRNMKRIDCLQFRADLSNSDLVSAHPDNVDHLADLYNFVPLDLLDNGKVVPDRPSSPWVNNDITKAKHARRRGEWKRKSGLVVHIEAYKQARNVTTVVKHAKACYFQGKLKEVISD